MDTGKAIFFGLALIALAIFATDALRPANAGIMVARYMGVPSAKEIYAVWVVDTETGAARHCQYLDSEGGECRAWLGVK